MQKVNLPSSPYRFMHFMNKIYCSPRYTATSPERLSPVKLGRLFKVNSYRSERDNTVWEKIQPLYNSNFRAVYFLAAGTVAAHQVFPVGYGFAAFARGPLGSSSSWVKCASPVDGQRSVRLSQLFTRRQLERLPSRCVSCLLCTLEGVLSFSLCGPNGNGDRRRLAAQKATLVLGVGSSVSDHVFQGYSIVLFEKRRVGRVSRALRFH